MTVVCLWYRAGRQSGPERSASPCCSRSAMRYPTSDDLSADGGLPVGCAPQQPHGLRPPSRPQSSGIAAGSGNGAKGINT